MLEVRQTRRFKDWFEALRDIRAKAQIARRIERAETGNLGDVASVGDGVSEMRIHHGAGYRVYFVARGNSLILLLCGGSKGSQRRDIADAKSMARELD
ncbi:type II toxin-antitoxin system RelE/ParE family toxin [Blastomonas sp.]|uniref:type II toxin-antitoxin system RelE/ParE family toxin n=1 Tax=Blastomonas sp. TaxID=1909299 RepID=UPI0026287E71|nr:type II toxin-antitoxin system RelE/ParE family toxin [Blastomonas sp.]MDM7957094.1 type II toxin-antitoxin system RelE/ParE family toxin [Blastomonas sp.]